MTIQSEAASPIADGPAAARSIVGKIVAATAPSDLGTEIGYANYADLVACNGKKANVHAKAVFGANYERMTEVKKTYDPTGVFNKWFSVAPAA